MNISTDFKHVSPDFNKKAGGYEWWYFDGQSKDGEYQFVIIFYHVNPFSVRYIEELRDSNVKAQDHPAISISVYHKSKTVYYSFLEFDPEDFSWDEQELECTVESHSFNYRPKKNEIAVNIKLSQKLASGHYLSATLRGEADRTNPNLIQSESGDQHRWNLIFPKINWDVDMTFKGIEGEKEVEFEGVGYHDHNTGNEPMKDSFNDWYWGRFHFKDFSLVYYLMQKKTENQFEGWLIDSNNKTVLEYFTQVDMEYFGRSLFGLKSAQKINLKGTEVTVNINCKDKIDNGPFYQRFYSNSVIKYKGQVHAAHGISEYIYPKNIYNQLYWPLIHMRLRYENEEPHWVQKSSLMYPWTW